MPTSSTPAGQTSRDFLCAWFSRPYPDLSGPVSGTLIQNTPGANIPGAEIPPADFVLDVGSVPGCSAFAAAFGKAVGVNVATPEVGDSVVPVLVGVGVKSVGTPEGFGVNTGISVGVGICDSK